MCLVKSKMRMKRFGPSPWQRKYGQFVMLNQRLRRGSSPLFGTVNRPMPRFVRHPGLGGVPGAERQAFQWLKTRRWLDLPFHLPLDMVLSIRHCGCDTKRSENEGTDLTVKGVGIRKCTDASSRRDIYRYISESFSFRESTLGTNYKHLPPEMQSRRMSSSYQSSYVTLRAVFSSGHGGAV